MSNIDRRRLTARPRNPVSCKALFLPVALFLLAGCTGGASGLSAYQADTSWGCKTSASGTIVCPRRR